MMCFSQHLPINNQTAPGNADPQLSPLPPAGSRCQVLQLHCHQEPSQELELIPGAQSVYGLRETEKVKEWHFGSLLLARMNDKPWQLT